MGGLRTEWVSETLLGPEIYDGMGGGSSDVIVRDTRPDSREGTAWLPEGVKAAWL